MNISISQAAQDWGVSRTTIYQKIKDGELSRGSDKKIDTAEMLRVFGEPKSTEQNIEQFEHNDIVVQSTQLNSSNTVQNVQNISKDTHLLALAELKNEHLSQQVKEQKALIEQYQRQVEQLNNSLQQANASIQELAQTRLIELKKQQPDTDKNNINSEESTSAENKKISKPAKKSWWQIY